MFNDRKNTCFGKNYMNNGQSKKRNYPQYFGHL